jgi:hypothetical protein
VIGRIEKGINLRDRNALGTIGDLLNPIARTDRPFLQNAKIKSRPTMRHHQCRHLGMVHPYAQPVAGDARLRDLEDAVANAKSISNANVGISQAVNRKVFAKLTVHKI